MGEAKLIRTDAVGRRTRLFFPFAIVVIGFLSEIPSAALGESYRNGVVAADHKLASRAGLEILKKGGNAVDAAVATAYALSVVRPYSCGLGGGGFMIVWIAEGRRAVAIDHRETAPSAATEDMFRYPGSEELIPLQSQVGLQAVGTPGTVAGLSMALRKFGTMELSEVIAPAISLADEGFVVDLHFLRTSRDAIVRYAARSDWPKQYSFVWKRFLGEGEGFPNGHVIKQPELADSLRRIAVAGPDWFYKGDFAESLAADMKAKGGLITREDLAGYEPKVREAIAANVFDHRVLSMPPPSSGGIALVEMFNILESYDDFGNLTHNSADYVHQVTESMKHAFADRAEWLGDSDFVDVPVDRLTSSAYAESLAKNVDPSRTHLPDRYGSRMGKGLPPADDGGTSHFSVIDRHGNAVACTETINLSYGSLVDAAGSGIILNNEMDDFAAAAGKPNAFGLLQSSQNAIRPGKRPLSSMSPTIVLDEKDRVKMVLGASGGPRIITAVGQVMLNVLKCGMSAADAVQADRFHHQWSPDRIELESALAKSVSTNLEGRGHDTSITTNVGICQLIVVSERGLEGASDPRKGGEPAGY